MSVRTMNGFAAHPCPGDCHPRVLTPILKAPASLEPDRALTSYAAVQQNRKHVFPLFGFVIPDQQITDLRICQLPLSL